MKRRHLLAKTISGIALLIAAGQPITTGAEPVKGTGSLTLYYIAEVDPAKAGSGGVAGKVKTTEGKWQTYRLTPKDTKAANIQGTVSVKEPDGSSTIVSIAKVGQWLDLPKGWKGKGNRMNPLTPYRTVAADQKHHPYGSRVFISDIKGFKTPEGEELDGYFWVADVGGGIKGRNRFDVFVGTQAAYSTIMEQPGGGGKWTAPVEVENLPLVSGEFNPKTDSGVKRILEGLGYEVGALESGKDASERKKKATSTAKMLTDFQKQHPKIPKTEYGSRIGAISLWYLTQAALALKEGQEYPVTPGAGMEKGAEKGDGE